MIYFSFLIDSVSYSCRYPLGVIGIVTSWASPLHSVLWHAIPALACGNCVIIKPSCLAPIEIHLLAKTFSDAGNWLNTWLPAPVLFQKKIRIKQEKNYHRDNQTPRISIADPHINTWVERDRKTIRAIPLPPPPPPPPNPPPPLAALVVKWNTPGQNQGEGRWNAFKISLSKLSCAQMKFKEIKSKRTSCLCSVAFRLRLQVL